MEGLVVEVAFAGDDGFGLLEMAGEMGQLEAVVGTGKEVGTEQGMEGGRDAAGSPSAWQGTGVDARGLPEEVSQVGELLFKRGDLGGCGALLRAKYRGSTRGAEEGIIDVAEDGEVGAPEAFE